MTQTYNPINLDLLLENLELSFRAEFLEQHLQLERAAVELDRRLGRYIAHSAASRKGWATKHQKQRDKINATAQELRQERAA